MAEEQPVVQLKTSAVELTLTKPQICGGLSDARDIEGEHKALFEEYRDIIQEKLHKELQVENNFKAEPVKVRTQVVAGANYFFDVPLPNNEVAQVKIFKPLPNHQLQSLDRSARVTVSKKTKEN